MSLLWRAVRTDVAPAALSPFRSTGGLAVPAAIAIYKNAYWIRQHEVLRELFPRLERALGEVGFRELVRRYLRACPSAHPELEHLGTGLPGFLRTQAPPLASLATVAALEQAIVESALAPNSAAATVRDIRPDRFAMSRLVFSASLRVVDADERVLRLLAFEGLDAIGGHAIAVARPRFATAIHVVGREEHQLLVAARGGATIGALLEAADHDVPAIHLHLHHWFGRRWIARLEDVP